MRKFVWAIIHLEYMLFKMCIDTDGEYINIKERTLQCVPLPRAPPRPPL